MDPERQPLLRAKNPDLRYRHLSRPLTTEEVLSVRHDLVWTRTRFCLTLMFWAIVAMFLSIITCIIITAKCGSFDVWSADMPSVPPVHRAFVPLIASGRYKEDTSVYTS